MRLYNPLLIVLTAATAILASSSTESPLIRAIHDMSHGSTLLNHSISKLTGNPIADLPTLGLVTLHTTQFFDKTRTASLLASRHANLTAAESFNLALPVFDLADVVNATVETMLHSEDVLRADNMAGVVGVALGMQKAQAKGFSDAMVRITPESDQEMTVGVAKHIAASFDKRLAVFQ